MLFRSGRGTVQSSHPAPPPPGSRRQAARPANVPGAGRRLAAWPARRAPGPGRWPRLPGRGRVDVDEGKIASLSRGEVPFYEPKLAPLLQSGLSSGNLHFTTSYREAIEGAHIVIFAVGTPSREDGSIDLQYLETSLKQAADYLQPQTIVAIKSTVLPGTLDLVKKIVSERCPHQLHYASLPEFLKEGSAVDDTLYPDRVVIGVEDDFTYRLLEQLHAPLKAPLLRVSPASAQLAKYASNDYLALRIVYANVISEICHHAGADIDEVLAIMGSEKRIGSHYWYPGLGYGGSCFPKDVKALAAYTKQFLPDSENLFAFINGLNNKRPRPQPRTHGHELAAHQALRPPGLEDAGRAQVGAGRRRARRQRRFVTRTYLSRG